jgi:hypothetical protein
MLAIMISRRKAHSIAQAGRQLSLPPTSRAIKLQQQYGSTHAQSRRVGTMHAHLVPRPGAVRVQDARHEPDNVLWQDLVLEGTQRRLAKSVRDLEGYEE